MYHYQPSGKTVRAFHYKSSTPNGLTIAIHFEPGTHQVMLVQKLDPETQQPIGEALIFPFEMGDDGQRGTKNSINI